MKRCRPRTRRRLNHRRYRRSLLDSLHPSCPQRRSLHLPTRGRPKHPRFHRSRYLQHHQRCRSPRPAPHRRRVTRAARPCSAGRRQIRCSRRHRPSHRSRSRDSSRGENFPCPSERRKPSSRRPRRRRVGLGELGPKGATLALARLDRRLHTQSGVKIRRSATYPTRRTPRATRALPPINAQGTRDSVRPRASASSAASSNRTSLARPLGMVLAERPTAAHLLRRLARSRGLEALAISPRPPGPLPSRLLRPLHC